MSRKKQSLSERLEETVADIQTAMTEEFGGTLQDGIEPFNFYFGEGSNIKGAVLWLSDQIDRMNKNRKSFPTELVGTLASFRDRLQEKLDVQEGSGKSKRRDTHPAGSSDAPPPSTRGAVPKLRDEAAKDGKRIDTLPPAPAMLPAPAIVQQIPRPSPLPAILPPDSLEEPPPPTEALASIGDAIAAHQEGESMNDNSSRRSGRGGPSREKRTKERQESLEATVVASPPPLPPSTTPKQTESEEGLTGPVGPPGLQGQRGEEGKKGDSGSEGPQGIAGITGPPGPKGDTGKDGKDGVAGKDGDTGKKGDPGRTGPIGASAPLTRDSKVVLGGMAAAVLLSLVLSVLALTEARDKAPMVSVSAKRTGSPIIPDVGTAVPEKPPMAPATSATSEPPRLVEVEVKPTAAIIEQVIKRPGAMSYGTLTCYGSQYWEEGEYFTNEPVKCGGVKIDEKTDIFGRPCWDVTTCTVILEVPVDEVGKYQNPE